MGGGGLPTVKIVNKKSLEANPIKFKNRELVRAINHS